ncbi:hypothetical protein K8W59_08565 [Nocardioides rotundus]|uniref:thioesterase II family protein n=1 Tax=Nocardioides rotundus TaxID=1774216 RepID=UPI001CBFD37E|nr:alpha/beta fold hydrolase [Nocardioides rotundus]UAL31476.1 hypothetical protein K8W59_08565 [Nocardioides rotundus]
MFPHAGASVATYIRLLRGAPAGAAVVRMPGRDLDEAAAAQTRVTAHQVTHGVVEAIGQATSEPLVIWGHSMGTLLALEAVRRLEVAGGLVSTVILSGRDFGDLAPESRHLWTEEELVGYLRGQGGTPEVVLEDRDMREYALATLRADFALAATACWDREAKVDARIVSVHGDADAAPSAEGMHAWLRASRSGGECVRMRGGHFFCWSDPAFLELITACVQGRG